MKITLSPENTLGPTPKGLVWEYLQREKPKKHLDYGTRDGNFLEFLTKSGVIEKGLGIDLNQEAIQAGKESLDNKDVQLVTIKKGDLIPYEENTFDSISMIGVLEHIFDQERILRELYRVLKKNGKIYVLVPGNHFFSFLDMGNFKFRFPKLHKLYVEKKYSKEFYKEHFIECKNGLFGDIETEKMWHQHFELYELKNIMSQAGFQILDQDGIGYFRRIFDNIRYFSPLLIKNFLHKLIEIDALKYSSSEILVIAKK